MQVACVKCKTSADFQEIYSKFGNWRVYGLFSAKYSTKSFLFWCAENVVLLAQNIDLKKEEDHVESVGGCRHDLGAWLQIQQKSLPTSAAK